MTVSNPAWAELISTFSAEFTIHFCCGGKNHRRKKSCVLQAVYTLLVFTNEAELLFSLLDKDRRSRA